MTKKVYKQKIFFCVITKNLNGEFQLLLTFKNEMVVDDKKL